MNSLRKGCRFQTQERCSAIRIWHNYGCSHLYGQRLCVGCAVQILSVYLNPLSAVPTSCSALQNQGLLKHHKTYKTMGWVMLRIIVAYSHRVAKKIEQKELSLYFSRDFTCLSQLGCCLCRSTDLFMLNIVEVNPGDPTGHSEAASKAIRVIIQVSGGKIPWFSIAIMVGRVPKSNGLIFFFLGGETYYWSFRPATFTREREIQLQYVTMLQNKIGKVATWRRTANKAVESTKNGETTKNDELLEGQRCWPARFFTPQTWWQTGDLVDLGIRVWRPWKSFFCDSFDPRFFDTHTWSHMYLYDIIIWILLQILAT